MAQVGRISGPLLTANLERNGIDLAFRNDLDTTQLLYIDVNTGKIGINRNAPLTELNITDNGRTTNLLNTTANIANFSISNNHIDISTGDITFSSNSVINVSTLRNTEMQINDNKISTYNTNSNLDLRPWRDYQLVNGDPYTTELLAGLTAASSGGSHTYKAFWEVVLPSGFQRGDINESGGIDIDDVMAFLSVARGITTSGSTYDRSVAAIEASLPTLESLANVNVYGNVHATGNITANGSLTFGDGNTDDIVLGAEIASNVIPDQNQTYRLGSPTKQWSYLYSNFLNGEGVTTDSISVGTTFHALRQGNIFWVAQNGDDTNVGDHPNGPFKTLKHALDQADASSSGPVTIHVMPGGYEEELPLVVPSNVTIKGEDMRNTIIRPSSADQSKDVFHLNGESTVQNITIKDFYYDSGNDTGYAFRFAPNTVVSTRSPYIQNVTVITQGSATSASDPRGFAAGDAGKGALIDGASVLSASNEASMLFHSATFITPGVDAITMTNGVRVEWLNSFTYFANKGLYAVNGTTGHLSSDGSTVKYGAELRSIGSANVYGNYGAYADGSDTLMYLIQHNFAYIGVGKFVDNDPSRVIQSQEVTELNTGKIYFQTVDHLGNFRVGDNFLVNQESGETSLVLTEADIDSFGGMTVTTNGSITVIDGTKVETGNIRFRDNTIRSLNGNIEIDSASSTINLTSSTNISKNVGITGDLSFGGTLNTLGDQTTDTIDFNVDFDQDLVPNTTLVHSLGTSTKIWSNLYGSEANFDTVKIFDNVITTNDSNANLELRASGTGKIYFQDENLNITNNLQVTGLTTLKNLSTNDLVTAGPIAINSNFSTTNLTISQNLDVTGSAQFEEILIDDNFITTTSSNTDLELRASSTGQILIPDADFTITNNFDVNGTMFTSDMNVTTSVTAVNFNNSTIQTQSNILETYVSNADLDLRATGDVVLDDAVTVAQDLTVTQNLSSSNLTTNSVTVGAINITNTFAMEDMKSSTDIQMFDNVITTTNSNSNLELRGAGSGSIYLQSLEFTGNTIGSESTPDSTLTDITFDVSNQLILNSNKALKLPAGPDGSLTQAQIRFNTDKTLFQGFATANVFFNGLYSDDSLTNIRAHPTNDTLLLDVAGTQIGSFDSDGINVHGMQVDDISIDGLTIQTTVSNSDLELKPDGTGGIVIDNITISGNTIENTQADAPINLSTTGDGYYQFAGDGAVKIPVGANSNRPSTPIIGQTRVNTDSGDMETWIGNQWQTSAGAFEAVSEAEMDDISLIQTLIYG